MQTITDLTKIREALRHQSNIECGDILGKGVFGEVVKASKNGEKYAIKLMPYTNDQTAEARKTLKYQRRELELLERMRLLGDSNVIKYYESWILQVGNAKKLCIQMELCSESLLSFVYKNKASPAFFQAKAQPQFYRHVFKQVLKGLHAIHSIGWVHRDIHPGNILVANPNPQKTSDIRIKIGDFGLARYIATMEITFELSGGWTINARHETLTPFLKDGLYTAPELLTDNYDFKVDLYSAGLVLYFISRNLDKNVNVDIINLVMNSEIMALKRGELEINNYVYHKDDEILCGLIKKLTQSNPLKRPSAREAMDYMFPTQAMDSTDSSKTSAYEFFVRKEDEEDVCLCFLKELTLSAVKQEVGSRIGVSELANEDLRQEREINGKTKRVKIDCDKVVNAMFRKAASDGSSVEIVVLEQPQGNSNVEKEQIESEQEKDETSSESL